MREVENWVCYLECPERVWRLHHIEKSKKITLGIEIEKMKCCDVYTPAQVAHSRAVPDLWYVDPCTLTHARCQHQVLREISNPPPRVARIIQSICCLTSRTEPCSMKAKMEPNELRISLMTPPGRRNHEMELPPSNTISYATSKLLQSTRPLRRKTPNSYRANYSDLLP